jgi:hypothetical protein
MLQKAGPKTDAYRLLRLFGAANVPFSTDYTL